MKKIALALVTVMSTISFCNLDAAAQQQPTAFIVDAHGVLVDFTLAKHVAQEVLDLHSDITQEYLKKLGNPLKILNQFLTEECPLCREQEGEAYSGCSYIAGLEPSCFVPMYKDEALAHILVEWKKGRITHEDARDCILRVLDEVTDQKMKEISKLLARYLFDVEKCQAAHVSNNAMISLLCNIKKHTEQNNGGDVQFYLLSNAYPEWLEKSVGAFLDLHFADRQMFAPIERMIKPDPEFFDHCLRKYGIEPSSCLLIDDKESVCQQARDLGMDAICYDIEDHAAFEQEMQNRELLR